MFVVGLTGGIGSGKSAAADEFEKLGAAVVDTDVIAHQLTGKGGASSRGILSIASACAITSLPTRRPSARSKGCCIR
jgi:dephospho-CoA kinase